MKPYSQDLRERILAAVETTHLSQAKIAQAFKISLSTFEKWCNASVKPEGAPPYLMGAVTRRHSTIVQRSSGARSRSNRT